jgi:hypothetical protein
MIRLPERDSKPEEKRVAALVQQRGVSFTLSERKIRDACGNAELLLAISKAKK